MPSIRSILHRTPTPIPTRYLREMLSLILQENLFRLNGSYYLQTNGTAMGTKMAIAFTNILMAKIERQILRQSSKKPLVWKRYIDDVFSLWDRVQSYPLVNPVPGLPLSKPADRGLTCSAERVGHVYFSNAANDLKDLS